jgi:DNA-binding CsgD family transcriptional regulator
VAAVSKLTDFQLQILGLIAAGFTDAEIAAKVFGSTRTIRAHKYRMLKALGANNGAHAVAIAYNTRIFTVASAESLPIGLLLELLVRAHGYELTERADQHSEI